MQIEFSSHLLNTATSQFDWKKSMHSENGLEMGVYSRIVHGIFMMCTHFRCRGGDLFFTLRGGGCIPPSSPCVNVGQNTILKTTQHNIGHLMHCS